MAEKVDTKVLKARKTLASYYDKRNMEDASRHVMSGAWDEEPFMLALLEILNETK